MFPSPSSWHNLAAIEQPPLPPPTIKTRCLENIYLFFNLKKTWQIIILLLLLITQVLSRSWKAIKEHWQSEKIIALSKIHNYWALKTLNRTSTINSLKMKTTRFSCLREKGSLFIFWEVQQNPSENRLGEISLFIEKVYRKDECFLLIKLD